MGKIVISTNVTLDGFVQDPDGQEGLERGGWFKRFGGSDLEAWSKLMTEEAMRAKALLLGRRTDQFFASRWSTRTGPWADQLNALPKYVVSSKADAPAWQNGRVLKGETATEVARLKERVDGDILVYASYQLGHALLDRDLVDELRLTVFPVVLGTGERLFGGTRELKALRLAERRTLGEGLVFLTYELARGA